MFNVPQRSLRLSSFLFILISLFCSVAVISTTVSSKSLIHSSASVILLSIPSSVFFTSVILFFISVCSLVLLGLLETFLVSSQSLSPILFLRSWIIFTIIFLSSFSSSLPISTSCSCFSGGLSYSFIWDVIVCIFILSNFWCCGFHSMGSGIVVLLASAVFPLVG